LTSCQFWQLSLYSDDSLVNIGSFVKCSFEYTDFTEDGIYEIVGYGEWNIDDNEIFNDTPGAKKLMGLKVGD
jgi:transcription elongation factor GreA